MRTHRNRVLNPSILHLSPWDPQPKETYPQKPIAKWETNTNFIKVEQVPQTPTLLKGGLQKKVRSSSKALSSPWSLNLGMTSCLSRVWVCVPNCLNNMPSLPYSPRLTHPEGQGRTHGSRVQKGKVQRGKESISESYINLPSGKVWPKEYFRHWPGRLAIFSLTRSSD